MTYGWGNNPWIWAECDWHKLKDYHQRQGSPRHYRTVGTAPPADIQSGDIVIDNARGMDPDHIQTAIAFDGRHLGQRAGNGRAEQERIDGLPGILERRHRHDSGRGRRQVTALAANEGSGAGRTQPPQSITPVDLGHRAP